MAKAEAGGDLLYWRADKAPQLLAEAPPLPDLRHAAFFQEAANVCVGTTEGGEHVVSFRAAKRKSVDRAGKLWQ